MEESNLSSLSKNLEGILQVLSQAVPGSCIYQAVKKHRNGEIESEKLEDCYFGAILLDSIKLGAYLSPLILYY